MFAYAPVIIASAPFESTMGLVQKIFYFPRAVVVRDVLGARSSAPARAWSSCRRARGRRPFAVAAAELAVVFGLIGLITGPLWARKAWGVWWEWDAR